MRSNKDVTLKKGIHFILMSYLNQTALGFTPQNAGALANDESIGESLCLSENHIEVEFCIFGVSFKLSVNF